MPIARTPPGPEPAPTSYVKELKTSRLYANDLDALLAFLRQRCESVTTRVGSHATINAGSELVEATGRERQQVSIETTQPAISVNLLSSGSNIQTSEVGPGPATELVDQVYELFKTWRNPLTIFPRGGLIFGFVITGVPFLLVAYMVRDQEPKGQAAQAVPYFIVIFLAFLGIIAGSARGRCVVLERSRQDARERSARVWLNLLVAVVSGVAGSLLTYAMTK